MPDLPLANDTPNRAVRLVQNGDVALLAKIALAGAIVLILFGLWLWLTGLLSFPDPAKSTDAGYGDYFRRSLDYRERRLAMSLVLRTFTIGFSFVVGLILCTQAGIFILRQVTAFTTLSANFPAGAPLINMALRAGSAPLFSFSSYSPGVVFLLGGVALMIITQQVAIPINAPEIIPAGAVQVCLTQDKTKWEDCGQPMAPTVAAKGPTTGSQPGRCKLPDKPDYCKTPAETKK